MARSRITRGVVILKARAWIAALGVLFLTGGCGDDNPGGPDLDTTPRYFTGFVTDGSETGTLAMTVLRSYLAPGRPAHRAGTGYVFVSATFTIRDTSHTVAGSYDDVADSLHMTGDGYVLSGHDRVSGIDPYLTGSVRFPGGTTGSWAAMSNINAQVSLYRGQWKQPAAPDSGTVNLLEGSQLLLIGTWQRAGGSVHLELSGGLGPKGAIYFFGGDNQTAEVGGDGVILPFSTVAEGAWSGTSHDPAYGSSGGGTWSATHVP